MCGCIDKVNQEKKGEKMRGYLENSGIREIGYTCRKIQNLVYVIKVPEISV
jgi:hypothetical protein